MTHERNFRSIRVHGGVVGVVVGYRGCFYPVCSGRFTSSLCSLSYRCPGQYLWLSRYLQDLTIANARLSRRMPPGPASLTYLLKSACSRVSHANTEHSAVARSPGCRDDDIFYRADVLRCLTSREPGIMVGFVPSTVSKA